MEKLNEKVMKAIKEGLPEATAGVLKEYFEDHENLACKYNELDLLFEESLDKIITLESEIEKLKGYKNRLIEIEKAEKNLAEEAAEINIQQRILHIERGYSDNAISEYKAMFNKVFDSVFRNTEIRKSVTKSHIVKNGDMNSGMYDNNGQPVMQDGGERVELHEDIETTEEK